MTDESSAFFDDDVAGADALSDNGYVMGERIYVSTDGYSEIYLARRAGKLFIVKTLRPEYRDDAVAIAALKKEFDLGFRLDVTGVVRTYDILVLPESGLSMVLEYCPGDNLRRLMDNGLEIDGPSLRNITRSLVGIVEGMHAAGVIHRDIKPSNIIYEPASGSLRLIDFGCADAFDHTLFKGAAGTRLYKADKFANTPAEDWYALSLTLSELAGHCRDKKAAKEVHRYCAAMKKGIRPQPGSDRHSQRAGRYVLYSLLLAFVAGITLYLAQRDRVSAPERRPLPQADSVAVNPDQAILTDSTVSVPENMVAVQPAHNELKEAEVKDERKETEVKGDKKIEESRSDIKEEEAHIVDKIREATGIAWIEAEYRKQSMYRQHEDLTPEGRDSIDRIIYDEKTNCDAILAAIGPLPQGTDMARVRSLIRKQYLAIFPVHRIHPKPD